MKSVFFVFLVTIFAFVFSGCSDLTDKESALIGRWKMIDYKDDVQRTGADLENFNKQMQIQMKMTLLFNEDKSYTATIEQASEMGKWWITEDGKTLVTHPTNGVEKRMIIDYISNDKLSLRIYEDPYTTKLTFTKMY